MKPRLRTSRLKNWRDPDNSFMLYVYDENGKLIMYSGPMSITKRSQLVEVLYDAGWRFGYHGRKSRGARDGTA